MTAIPDRILAIFASLILFGSAQAQVPELIPQIGHSKEINSCAFSPDGRMIVSGSEDGTIKLWDHATGRLIHTFEGHAGPVNSTVFSPDGRILLSGSSDATAKLWDIASGKVIRTSKPNGVNIEGDPIRVRSALFSADGQRYLVTNEDDSLKLVEVRTGKLVRGFDLKEDGIAVGALSPDMGLALATDGPHLKLWDSATGKLIWNVDTDGATSIAFSPNGGAVLSGDADKKLTLRDVVDGHQIMTLTGHSWPVSSVAFSSNGKFVLSGAFDDPQLSETGETPGRGHGEVKVWDAATGKEIHTFTEHAGSVKCVAFSPDDNLILASDDNVITEWDRASGRPKQTFHGNGAAVASVTFSPDNRLILSGSNDHRVRVWNLAAGRPTRTFAGHSFPVTSVVFSPDGKLALSAGFEPGPGADYFEGHGRGDLKLWEIGTGHLVHSFEGHSDQATAVFSPNGHSILSAGKGKLKLWNATTGQLIRSFGPAGPDLGIYAIAFSSDGHSVITVDGVSQDQGLDLWNADTGKHIRSFEANFAGHVTATASIRFSPEGRNILLGDDYGTVILLNAATGKLVRTFARQPENTTLIENHFITSVEFSPDGNIALAASKDNTLKLWNAKTGQLIRTIEAEGMVDAASFAHDGSLIATAADGTIKVINPQTGEVLATLIASPTVSVKDASAH